MQATPSFDLLREPWIPCESCTGERLELGMLDTFARAHDLAAVHDASPPVVAVLHRLLLVVLDRALQPRTIDDWVALWEATTLPMQDIEVYLERHRDRFDLFHPKRPFMQVAGLEQALAQDKGKPPERLSVWRTVIETSPCGRQMDLFEPMPQQPRLSAAAAARTLLTIHGYSSGGRIPNEAASWTGGMLRGGALTLVRGKSLRDTLLLNLVWRTERSNDDLPPWERARDIARVVRKPAGPADLMLWPSRRVQLFPVSVAGTWAVEEILTAAGERPDGEIRDPQMAFFVRNPKKPPMAVRFDPDRSPWRDSSALFRQTDDSGAHQRPEAVTQLAELITQGIVARPVRHSVLMLGMATEKAVIRLWRSEQLPVPGRLLTDPNRVSTLHRALEVSDQAARVLDRKALYVLCERILVPGTRKADSKDVQAMRNSLSVLPAYWDALGAVFPSWLLALGDADDPDDALPPWFDAVHDAAREAFDRACARAGTTARALEAAAQAEQALRWGLREVLPQPENTSSKSPSAHQGASP